MFEIIKFVADYYFANTIVNFINYHLLKFIKLILIKQNGYIIVFFN